MEQQQENPVFTVEKLYVKDLSVEVPNAPEIFLEREGPNVSIQLNTQARGVGDAIFEVVLTVTVTAKIGEKTVFLIEVGQAGLFQVRNVPEENMEPLMGIACPNILFPYAREVISDATIRAGFSPVVLQPVNFESLYMSRQQAADAAEAPASGEPHEVTIQ